MCFFFFYCCFLLFLAILFQCLAFFYVLELGSQVRMIVFKLVPLNNHSGPIRNQCNQEETHVEKKKKKGSLNSHETTEKAYNPYALLFIFYNTHRAQVH